MTTATAEITITPAIMAQAFWGMDSVSQMEFFKELSRYIKKDQESGNNSAYSQGELQWFYLGDELSIIGNDEARSMLMTMAAPLYLNTLRFAGR